LAVQIDNLHVAEGGENVGVDGCFHPLHGFAVMAIPVHVVVDGGLDGQFPAPCRYRSRVAHVFCRLAGAILRRVVVKNIAFVGIDEIVGLGQGAEVIAAVWHEHPDFPVSRSFRAATVAKRNALADSDVMAFTDGQFQAASAGFELAAAGGSGHGVLCHMQSLA